MAEVFADDFESGNTNLWDTVVGSPTIETGITGMEGTYCLYLSTGGDCYVQKALTENAEYYIEFLYKVAIDYYAGEILAFFNGTTQLCRLIRDPADSKLKIYIGTGNPGTLLATGSASIGTTTVKIAVHYKPHDTAGIFQVKVNDVLDIDFSGDTTEGSTTITSMLIGGVGAQAPAYYAVCYIDSVVVDDSAWPGAPTNFEYAGQVPLTLIPQAEYAGPAVPFEYAGQVPLTLIPQAVCGGPHAPLCSCLLRLTPIAACELYDPGAPIAIPASTGGFKLGGAGVWGSETPTATVIPAAVDPYTGFNLDGGAAVGEAELISTLPPTDEIVAEGGFKFCGPEVTGDAATFYPPSEAIEAEGGFKFGGEGVWDQVRPEDIPNTVIVSSGGFVLSGSGLSTDPVVTPTTTVITSTGGFKLGGHRPDPLIVTYPGSADRTIGAVAAFEMGGEGVWGDSLPPTTVIVSEGVLFVLGGDGIISTKSPPVAVITGDGGFVMGGTGQEAPGFDTWVLTGNGFEPSLYANFDFNSYAQFRGQYFGAKDDGIYLLSGPDDDGEAIHPGVRIGPTNLGTVKQKRIRTVSIGEQSNGAKVRVQAGDRVGFSDVVRGHAFVSRNLQAGVMVIDIQGFDEISHVEIVPLVLSW